MLKINNGIKWIAPLRNDEVVIQVTKNSIKTLKVPKMFLGPDSVEYCPVLLSRNLMSRLSHTKRKTFLFGDACDNYHELAVGAIEGFRTGEITDECFLQSDIDALVSFFKRFRTDPEETEAILRDVILDPDNQVIIEQEITELIEKSSEDRNFVYKHYVGNFSNNIPTFIGLIEEKLEFNYSIIKEFLNK